MSELNHQVDALFSEWDRWDSPGASIAVIRDGEIVYKRGYGSANLEYNVAITPSTIFHVASVSKQFTCFSVLMLQQDGKLSVDDDIRHYVPETPDFGTTITLRHVMNHTSGIRDQWQLHWLSGGRLDDVVTQKRLLNLIAGQRELNFPPGDQYAYCNSGYTLLAEVVARVGGASFHDWTRDRLFKPLGMSNTQFYDDHERIVPNRAYSYGTVEGGFKKRVLSFANVGATSLFTTVEDLAKWIANFETGEVGGKAVVEALQEQGVLNDGTTLNYAMGVTVNEHRGVRMIGHSGGDAGFASQLDWYPEHRLGVVVLANLQNVSPGLRARQIADLYLADALEPEPQRESPTRHPIELDAARL
ncbi:MAG: serine hydrolase, partial [Candidatus Poribacteria bacterium]|nr:serine hydrolase [Candidatus Poribacteria bacterium]